MNKILHSIFLKNTGWIIFAQIYQMIIQLIIGVISARYLGPSNYGTINYAASFVSFFTIICSLGMEGISVNEIVKNRKKEGEILGSCIVYRLISGILSMFSVLIIVYLVNPNDKLLLIVAFLQSLSLVFNAFNIIDVWYQSQLKSKTSTLIKCLAYTVVSIYKIYVLISKKI